MTRTVSRGDVGDPGADHHVEPVLFQQAHHGRRRGGVVSIVAVYQHVDIGIDVGEGAADDMALALQRLAAHQGAGKPRRLHGIVTRIVVVDVDRRLGQRPAKVRNHLRYRHGLVVAGDQNRDAQIDIPGGAGHGPWVGIHAERLLAATYSRRDGASSPITPWARKRRWA